MAGYIILANSDASLSKQFRVVDGTFEYRLVKTQSKRRTITGKTDVQEGPYYKRWAMTLQIKGSDDAAYGTPDNLRTLYALADPTATPTNTLTLTDFGGNTHSVCFANHDAIRWLATTAHAYGPRHIQIELEAV